MMNEIKSIKEAINPNEILFVVDSMTGQDAVNTAKAFDDVLNFDGVVLTKLDGDTKGGAAQPPLCIIRKIKTSMAGGVTRNGFRGTPSSTEPKPNN